MHLFDLKHKSEHSIFKTTARTVGCCDLLFVMRMISVDAVFRVPRKWRFPSSKISHCLACRGGVPPSPPKRLEPLALNQACAFAANFDILRPASRVIFKKYKTFSVLIYSYINTSGNWKNEKLCGISSFSNSMSVDITVYQYGKNVLYFFYNIAQRTLTEEWREIFRVDIELYQHGS